MLQFYYFTEPRFERHIGKHLQSTDRIQKHSNMRLAQYNCARDRSCTFIQDETCQGTNVWTMKSRRMHDRTSGGYCVWAKGIMYPTFESFISPRKVGTNDNIHIFRKEYGWLINLLPFRTKQIQMLGLQIQIFF